VILGLFGVIQGLFRVIQGLFGVDTRIIWGEYKDYLG
jgi:hypothetical protein